MPFSDEQMATIDRLLPINRVEEGADRAVPISLTARELRFLLEAIDRFKEHRCAVEGLNSECEMMYWYESALGHIERNCEHFCERLIGKLLAQIPEKHEFDRATDAADHPS